MYTNLLLFHFQTKLAICLCITILCLYTHLWSPTMVTKTSKTTNFWASNPIHCVWQVGERNQQSNRHFAACFFYSKLSHWYKFSLVASISIYGKFHTSNLVCLNMHCFCSLDIVIGCVNRYPIIDKLCYIKQLFTNLFCYIFRQRIVIHMSMHIHDCHTVVVETSKTTK